MTSKIFRFTFIIFFLVLKCNFSRAQDKRSEFPGFLLKNYFGVSIGYLNYFDPAAKLEPGFTAGNIRVPATGLRIVFGHYINKTFSLQLSDIRPVSWIIYENINGDNWHHSLWINEAELTLKGNIHLGKNFSLYGESGLGFFTQSEIKIHNLTVVNGENYLTVLLGAGLQYRLGKKWNIMANAISPVHLKTYKPYKAFYSGGFTYDVHYPKPKKNMTRSKAPYNFPLNLTQIGYATNVFGYGANSVVEKAHIFWGGDVEVKNGFTLNYQCNVYHGYRVFSLSLGTGFSYWTSRMNHDNFFILSLFPVFRFTPVHLKSADLYFNYCIAGPSYISRVYIDNNNTGTSFTFQDYLGIGAFTGKRRNLNAEIRVGHYSNGGLFPQNGGIKIPLTFMLGYSF